MSVAEQPGAESEPDNTAIRTALWRAMHVEVDDAPHVLDDTVGLQLVDPDPSWRERPDMDRDGTAGFRASMVSRGRFLEDLVTQRVAAGVDQLVILGAGLDTIAERRPDLAARLQIFEIDQPGTQAWKRRRMAELGLDLPDGLHFVPIDFEHGQDWWAGLMSAGFDPSRPAVVASTGVSMYLAKETNAATLRRLAGLAPGSAVAMTFLLPIEQLDSGDRDGLETSRAGARRAGTPFVSFYRPDELLAVARAAGFADVEHIAGTELGDRYFAGRADGLRPSSGEDFLIART